MGRLILGIPTYNQFEFLANEMLPSIFRGTVLPDFILLWDNSPGGKLTDFFNDPTNQEPVKRAMVDRQHLPPHSTRLIIQGEGTNVALAFAWNTIIASCDDNDTIIVSNDDIRFFPDTLEKLAASTQEFNYPAGARAGNSFSLYRIDKKMWNAVGPFDQNFYPAYFEDNDYHYRMKLLGYDIHPLLDCEYDHVGSATVKSIQSPEETEKRHSFFRLNEMYYIYKWGGKPGQEVYTVPFNGKPYDEAIAYFAERFK